MAEVFNVYCDESCHLEHDGFPTMVIGAVWCPQAATRQLCQGIREIKARHGLPTRFESKWTKVSPAKLPFYLDMVDFFFAQNDLHFRGVLIPDKRMLNHALYNQTHDDWYYKMFFRMLEVIIDPEQQYRIYIDIKDTRSEHKRAKLEEVLRNAKYDFAGQIIEHVQQIRSHESEILQLADLLIGGIAYNNRELTTSEAKIEVVARIQERSRKTLRETTWLRERKLNLLRWQPDIGGGPS